MLHRLKDCKNGLSDIEEEPKLQNILKQLDDLISSVDLQLVRLKQMVTLREQYINQITEITMFISKYTEIVREIERPRFTIQDRIRKYEEVSFNFAIKNIFTYLI